MAGELPWDGSGTWMDGALHCCRCTVRAAHAGRVASRITPRRRKQSLRLYTRSFTIINCLQLRPAHRRFRPAVFVNEAARPVEACENVTTVPAGHCRVQIDHKQNKVCHACVLVCSMTKSRRRTSWAQGALASYTYRCSASSSHSAHSSPHIILLPAKSVCKPCLR